MIRSSSISGAFRASFGRYGVETGRNGGRNADAAPADTAAGANGW